MPTKYPPKLSLDEAVATIKAMYAEHKSREVSIDLMPEILNTKQGSSFFNDKISALQRFGFVQKMPNDLLYITDLAMQIIKPVGNDDLEAKIQAFKKIDVLSDLMLKYPNGKLPSQDQLQSSLMKVYQVPRDTVRAWSSFVVNSFRAISDIAEKPIYPSQESHEVKSKSTGTIFDDLFPHPQPKLDYQITLPIEGGEQIKLSIPRRAKPKDLKILKSMIDALGVEEN